MDIKLSILDFCLLELEVFLSHLIHFSLNRFPFKVKLIAHSKFHDFLTLSI
jgi:hypothetical protein